MRSGSLRRINHGTRRSSLGQPAPITGRAVLVPLGAEEPFDDLAPLEPLSDDDKAALGDLFDRSQPPNGTYRGLLNARVEDES
jgi:hypothetical protein